MEPTVSKTMPAGPATLSESDLPAGTPVGEYVIESKIGEGGFGAVFRAHHPLIGKVAAIKVLSKRFSADREMVSRFQAEARAVNQIRHRNIIDIFSFGTLDDGRCYYVMELLDGMPLDRRIHQQKRIPLAEALPILRAVARAIDAAHEKGIAHRDLKAENVFLATDSDGGVFPKLLDFGIAKLMDPDDGAIAHKTRTGAPMGTPYYMSPEQCRGRNIDTRTDHYAFGVLAYVMLTGKFPIDAEDYMTILMRQVTDEPEPPSRTVPELSQGVDHTIAWLMAKDPAQRPEDLMTAVRALEEAAGMPPAPVSGRHATVTPSALAKIPTAITARGRDVHGVGNPATAATVAPTLVPPRSRTGLVIGIVAVAAIAAVVVAYVATRGGSKDEPKPQPAVASNTPAVDAAQAAPPADAPAQVAAVDATPSNITVTIADAPAGAEVHIGGRMFGTAPKVMIPHGELEAILVVSADGFVPQSVPLVPDKDQKISVKLKKKDATPVGIGSARPPPRPGSGTAAKPLPPPKPGSAEPTDDIDTFPK